MQRQLYSASQHFVVSVFGVAIAKDTFTLQEQLDHVQQQN